MDEIRENPNPQNFLGFPAYSYAQPFDASMMTWFREQVTPEMLAEVNDYITGRKTHDDKDESETPPASGEGSAGAGEEQHEGTLILDATCCPQNIRFPTDISLLNEGRELLEKMIDTAHEAGATEGKKTRTIGTWRGGIGCGTRKTESRPGINCARQSASNWDTSGET